MLTDNEKALLIAGERIQVIKSIRARMGTSLSDSRDLLDTWIQGIHLTEEEFLREQLNKALIERANINNRILKLTKKLQEVIDAES